MAKNIRRAAVMLGAAAAAVALSAGPASAHIITVTNPHTGEVVHNGWVGGRGAAHVHGLVTACGALASNDAVAIYTNWNPANSCTHF